jgi:hypothetical protein
LVPSGSDLGERGDLAVDLERDLVGAGEAVVEDDLQLRLRVVEHVQQRRFVGGDEVELALDDRPPRWMMYGFCVP